MEFTAPETELFSHMHLATPCATYVLSPMFSDTAAPARDLRCHTGGGVGARSMLIDAEHGTSI